MSDGEHFVQFYESDDFLVHSVGGFIGSALKRGDAGVVVATPVHRERIDAALAALDLDTEALIAEGRYAVLDAEETVARVTVGGWPDEARVNEVFGALVRRMTSGGLRLRVFGEVAPSLVEAGNRAAAVRLEELANGLAAQQHRVSIFCAYPVTAQLERQRLSEVCRHHSGVIPAESYASLDGANERMRAVVELQQRTLALAAEVDKRTEIERALVRRLRESQMPNQS